MREEIVLLMKIIIVFFVERERYFFRPYTCWVLNTSQHLSLLSL